VVAIAVNPLQLKHGGSISTTITNIYLTFFTRQNKRIECRKAQLLPELPLDVASVVIVKAFGVIHKQGNRGWLATNLGAVVNFSLTSLATGWGECWLMALLALH